MTKAEQVRVTAWRLKILRYSQGEPRQVARTCRHFGISRTAFYRWKKRFDELGEAGLADRPRTPHRSPRATPRVVVSKILYLRQHYHFGAGRIAAYLRRFHQVEIARSSVHRILDRHGMGRLPANQKHQPHRQRNRFQFGEIICHEHRIVTGAAAIRSCHTDHHELRLGVLKM